MKKSMVLGLTVTAVAAAVSTLAVNVSAGPLQRDGAGDFVAARDIAAGVRAAGLNPAGALRLRGRYYVLDAVDARGIEMRVLADAQDGSILSILPTRRAVAAPPASTGSARIIHVPQRDAGYGDPAVDGHEGEPAIGGMSAVPSPPAPRATDRSGDAPQPPHERGAVCRTRHRLHRGGATARR